MARDGWPGRRARLAQAGATPAAAGAVATVAAVAAVAVAAAGIAACSAHRGTGSRSGSRLQPSYESTVRQVLPSVVEIDAGQTTGSGVVLDSRGYIVTNAHVVGTAKHFKVLASVLSTPLRARLIGVFVPDDLAVIKVSGPEIGNLKPARLAESARAQVGEIVLAMGSPYGLTDSVTQGIVSAVGRTVSGQKVNGEPQPVIHDAVQTSAAINPGNSGGALVLLSGRVLGIPTLSATDPHLGTPAEGIGFAIPADTVRAIAGQLIRSGKVTRPGRASLDFTGRTHVSSTGSQDGVTVDQVPAGAATASAGVRAGDVIVGLGGRAVTSLNQLDSLMLGYLPGQRVTVELLRGGNPRQVTIRLGSTAG